MTDICLHIWCAHGRLHYYHTKACNLLILCVRAQRYPQFDIERIKRGQGTRGWSGPLEALAAKCGDKWKPFMTLETAQEAGLC